MENTQIMSNRAFTKMACSIALPIAVQNMISTLVNSADTFMLGYVSQEALAASSLANQVQFILVLVFYGLTTGSGVMMAQYWGKKDMKAIERILGIGLRFALFISALTWAAAFLFPAAVMRIFTNEKEIIEEGVKYLRILSFSYLVTGITQMYFAAVRSMERVMLPTISYGISLGVNILINATFIFGLFGAPKLGIVGVAIGTVVARIIELLICLIDSARSKVKIRISCLFMKGGVLQKDLLKLSAPTMINDLGWSLAFSMYSVILGHLGGDVVAANSVGQIARNLGKVLCMGFANGTAIILGKTIGEGLMDAAKVYAKRMVRLTSITGIIGGVLILMVRPLLLMAFESSLTPQAMTYLGIMLFINAYYVWAQGMNTCWICGCFRAGGDVKYGMYCDLISMWLYAVPLGFLVAFVFKLPVMWVYFILFLDEFAKMPFIIHHFRKFKWLQNITRDAKELG